MFAALADTQRAGVSTPIAQIFDGWHSLLFGHQVTPTLIRYPAPWHWALDPHELVEVDIAFSAQLIVVQAAVVGSIEVAWFDQEGLPITQSLTRVLGSEGASAAANAEDVAEVLSEALLSESLERSLEELLSLSMRLDFDSTSEVLDLVSLRVRHLQARRVFSQSLRGHQGWINLLEAGDRNLEVLSQALNLGQLRLLAAKAAEADAAHQSDLIQRTAAEERRASVQRRADRRLSIWAAILVLPSLWFGFLGVSQSPPNLFGIRLASKFGQLLVISGGAVVALIGLAVVLVMDRRKVEEKHGVDS